MASQDINANGGEYVHKTVLLHESIDGLGIKPGDVYLDGTLGSAGHAVYAATFGTPEQPVIIIGIDQDDDALARSTQRFAQLTQSSNGNSNFNPCLLYTSPSPRDS